MVTSPDISTVIIRVLVQLGFLLQQNLSPGQGTQAITHEVCVQSEALWPEEKAEVQAGLHHL